MTENNLRLRRSGLPKDGLWAPKAYPRVVPRHGPRDIRTPTRQTYHAFVQGLGLYEVL